MADYTNLGHMSLDTEVSTCNSIEYFLPHHGVVKTDSQTTKLRVVFDASAKTTSGYSLNDLQMVGYKVQQNLLSITMRFRKHKFVVSSDIAKMYRQIQIDSNDANFQNIFWRETVLNTLNVYKLNTVTYGTAAASFLAIRCLYQLAIENGEKFPRAAIIIANDFYVDDMLTGAETVEELADVCEEVINILSSGCFELRKWISNSQLILDKITSDKDTISDVLKIGGDDAKTLGLFWNSQSDILMYNIKYFKTSESVTKRVIISNVAKIFDPLGLLGPCIITAKIILQKLWQHKLTWDESVPADLHLKWCTFQNQMQGLNKVRIPRHVLRDKPIVVEMHGFSDSSEGAYGACVYMRSIDAENKVTVKLLCAKSRVAPLKCLSIPRLELCGALLLAQLAERVEESMEIEFRKKTFWTDSSIVLCWIKTEPSLLKTFVANRISEIQTLNDVSSWFHVGTKDNPADLLSRSINPLELEHCQMWWTGPSWLSENSYKWPNNEIQIEVEIPELKSTVSLVALTVIVFTLFDKFSCLNKLVRVFAYCRRYIKNSKVAINDGLIGQLSVNELDHSLTALIKLSQGQIFNRDIDNLSNNKYVNPKSKLANLCPFMNKEGIIRVGGRLARSDFSDNKMHPIVLPPGHNLTKLVARHEHIRCLHAGAQAVLALLRERYWPIAGRNLAKGVIRACITCFRVKPNSHNQLMGELPAERLASTRAFVNCGVDVAGPLLMKDRRGRGCKSLKVYACVFVCFAIKAVHLELVTDLSAEAFIAAFRRFAARRGKPTNMYSDNGTNFVGANTEIIQLLDFLKSELVKNEVVDALANDGVSWHFIPARSPHFGGLWEAGVKSMKSHMRRVIGSALLTFEQLYTALAQIEAVMNSRPLSPMSSDPNDLNPLTPAHFLIGESLMSIPDPSLRHLSENTLSEFQRCQKLAQHFWTGWAREYVSELQQRYKWKTTSHVQLKVGSMVIMKDDNLPPLKWQLGRVMQLHPGSDSVVRVVSVKSGNSVVKHAITKICVLPMDD